MNWYYRDGNNRVRPGRFASSIGQRFLWHLCLLLLCVGTLTHGAETNQATAIISALSSDPDNKALLAQLQASLPTLTNRADRCLPGVIYCLGCLAVGETSEGLTVREQILKAYPLEAFVKALAYNNIAAQCDQCTQGRSEAACKKCQGTGNCPICGGSGVSRTKGFDGQSIPCTRCRGQSKCRDCEGTRKTEQSCTTCGGRGMAVSQSKCQENYLRMLRASSEVAVVSPPGVTPAKTTQLREETTEGLQMSDANAAPKVSNIDAERDTVEQRQSQGRAGSSELFGPIHEAALSGNIQNVTRLLNNGAEVDARNRGHATPLMMVAISGDLEMLRFLISKGANVNATNNAGLSPLMGAAMAGHLDMVECLICKGARVDATDKSGFTALMGAAGQGYLDVVEYLVAKKANVNATSIRGWTALKVAEVKGREDVVAFLEQHKD